MAIINSPHTQSRQLLTQAGEYNHEVRDKKKIETLKTIRFYSVINKII